MFIVCDLLSDSLDNRLMVIGHVNCDFRFEVREIQHGVGPKDCCYSGLYPAVCSQLNLVKTLLE